MQLLPDVEVGHVLPVRHGDGKPLLDDALPKAIEAGEPSAVDGLHLSNDSGSRVSRMPVIIAKLTGPSM